jgi:hypothetical protein
MNQKKTEVTRSRRALIITLLVAATSTSAFGIFGLGDIVYDPKLDATLNALHAQAEATKAYQVAQQIAEWSRQFQNMKEAISTAKEQVKAALDWHNYMEVIHGQWRRALPGLRDENTASICMAPVNIRAIGWGNIDDFKKVAATRTAADALDQLRLVLDARATSNDLGVLRDNIETVYGEVPVTQAGILVEAAHREIGSASAFTGQLNIAIQEKLENIRKLKEEINSGELAPGDIERKMVLVQAEEADIGLLQAQAINQSNRLAINQLGFQASQAGSAEINRLKDRSQRLEMLSGINFGLAYTPRNTGRH